MNWINKDTEIYCSFAKQAGNTGCQLMNSMFYYYGLNKIYKSFSIDNIKDGIDAVRILNIKGFAVTMPFKIDVIDYLDDVSEEAEAIGAVNTVINDNGKLKGYNTDYKAAMKMILDKYNGEDFIYILGDGGYARSVKYACKCLDMSYNIITRKNWTSISRIKESLIYNCTPVENIEVDESNTFIDCIVSTSTGKELATIQASHQFELYTGLKFFFQKD